MNNISDNIIKHDKDIINDINTINNELLDLTTLIDKKTLQIYEENEINDKKISQYKTLMENIILEYHKICKELFKND